MKNLFSGLHDTAVMFRRTLRYAVRNTDTFTTVAVMPILIMLTFVFVFGNSIKIGPVQHYIDFVVPGIALMSVANGIAYAALRLNNDMTKGIINRFRCLPIARSSVLNGHVLTSVVFNLFSVALIMGTAFALGFRPHAGLLAWTEFAGLLTLVTAALSWTAMIFGQIASTPEGAGGFSYVVLLFLFLSSAFAPADGMNRWVRAVASHQPMTPIIETARSLLLHNRLGGQAWAAALWGVGILAASYITAVAIYKRRAV
ncbi:MAG TPA: ABC transporter permease [Candidatus Saccharimonadales bacterium]|nr:ABC transporter permease [Candidatus Saccharimonadales bacterium]